MLQSIWEWLLDPGFHQVMLVSGAALLLGLFLGLRLRPVPSDGKKPVSIKGDRSFFKGIQYLLSDDHDQAIEEFTKYVQVNSDTIETYVALGNLYRSRGDIDRAIRIRQSIILRPNIDEGIKTRAMFDLGRDYRKGGFLNLALKTFLEVARRDPSDVKTQKEIERIYEELRDWESAYTTRQKIARLEKGDHQHILAHYLVETGKVCLEEGDFGRARTLFTKALTQDRHCADAYLHLGDLYFVRQDYKRAIATWKKIVETTPRFTFLAYRRLESAYSQMRDLGPVRDFLKECVQSNPDAFTHLALARYLNNDNDVEGALKEIEKAIELAPSFWEARRFKGEILLKEGREEDVVNEYREIISRMTMPYLRFQCSECGFEPADLVWRCPQCNRWDSIGLMDSAGASIQNPARPLIGGGPGAGGGPLTG